MRIACVINIFFLFLFHTFADFVLFCSRARTLFPLLLWLLHIMTSCWRRTGGPILFTLPRLIDSETAIYFSIYFNLLIRSLFSSLSVFILLFLLFFYNGLKINNGSQKHNYIYKHNNSPTTCFGLIRPSSGWKYSVRGKIICLI